MVRQTYPWGCDNSAHRPPWGLQGGKIILWAGENPMDTYNFLPVSRADMEERGWWYYDFLLVTADAYSHDGIPLHWGI